MSKLDELIRELCPDGVEYKTLGEIAVDIYRGAGITRDQVTAEGTPCVRYGEIYTTYGVWFDKCVSHTDEAKLTSKKYFEYGDILFAITGESVDDIAKCCVYIGHEKCLAGGDIVVLKHNQNPKYLSYALATTDARQQKSKGKVKSKVVHSSVPAIREIKVPVPPIEVQREIVRILDSYTESVVELQKQLTAELIARKTQYSFYRSRLLTFDADVEWKTVDEIAEVTDYVANGSFAALKENVNYKHTPDYAILVRTTDLANGFDEENLVYIDKHAYNYLSKSKLYGGEIIINNIGAGVGTTFLCPCLDTYMSLAPNSIMVKTSNNKFYYYWLNSKEGQNAIRKIVSQGSLPKFNKTGFRSIRLPVPPLDVQNRIVNVLDNFEKICSDLNIGLPAEIEARQKQYEYYRDKLLTFAETGNTILSRAEQSRAEQSRAEQSRAEQSRAEQSAD